MALRAAGSCRSSIICALGFPFPALGLSQPFGALENFPEVQGLRLRIVLLMSTQQCSFGVYSVNGLGPSWFSADLLCQGLWVSGLCSQQLQEEELPSRDAQSSLLGLLSYLLLVLCVFLH